MKKNILKIILAVVVILIFPKITQAAIHADTVWEFRATASANMVNGGGFNASNASPGTDYSQQDAAQDSGTDLASVGMGTAGVVSSASHTFTADDQGNFIHITAGTNWTAGWYEIVSVSGGNATLDRGCGGSLLLSNGTWYLGGALSLNSTLDNDFFIQIEDGNTVWFKSGSYTQGESVAANTIDATADDPIKVYGYQTTRGDNPTGANRPSIDRGGTYFTTGQYWDVENFVITGTGTNMLGLDPYSLVVNCKITNTSETADRLASSSYGYGTYVNNELSSTNGNAVSLNSGGVMFYGNYIHDSAKGINLKTQDYNIIAFNIFDNCTSAIFSEASAVANRIMNNTFYGAETPAGTALNMQTGDYLTSIVNNIIYGFTTGVTIGAEYDSSYSDYNNFYNNTSNRNNIATGAHDTAVDPGFTDAANGNFAIGTNIKALGFPGAFPGGLTTGYLDIGAVQRVEGTTPGTTNIRGGVRIR